jgi:thiol-disulfide isomerase/thioredoxin
LLLFLLCGFTLHMYTQSKPKVLKIDKLVKRYTKSKDTLYIVNFWATWCKPCVAELPAFEEIHNEYKNKAVKVILVSMDFKEDLNKKLLPFLKKNNYTSEVVLLDEIDGNKFINRVDSSWTGSIPASLFIKGPKRQFKEKQLKKEELQSIIEEFNK